MGGEERRLRVVSKELHRVGKLRRNQRFGDDHVLGGGVLTVGNVKAVAEETNEVGGGGERLPSAR